MPGAPYRKQWEIAFKSYINGNWGEAKTKFEDFMKARPDIKTTEVMDISFCKSMRNTKMHKLTKIISI